MPRETRPDITTLTNGSELRRWYWLCAELSAEAKQRGIKSSGAKFDILDRLAHFMDTGEADLPAPKKPRIASTFD